MPQKSKKGFTIIEVVLVLAIAGLIFLMVFIALPNMQRSQRDTQRRQDYAALSSNITNYITNNNGRLPSGTLSASVYINKDGKDPRGNAYTLTVVEAVAETTPANLSAMTTGSPTVYVVTHADCSGTNATDGTARPKKNSASRSFAIYGQLETGTYCQASE